MKTYRRLSLAEEEKIKQYLKSIARDGLVGKRSVLLLLLSIGSMRRKRLIHDL